MKYLKLFESFSEYDIYDASWIYMVYIYIHYFKQEFKFDSWKNDTRMDGRKFSDSFRKLNMSLDEEGNVTLTDDHIKIMNDFFYGKTLKDSLNKSLYIKDNYKQEKGGYDYYKIHTIPKEYFLRRNPKIDKYLDKIRDVFVDHYNSQICNSRHAVRMSKMRGIKEYNLINFYYDQGHIDIDKPIKLYRGVKRKYEKKTEGISCWTTNKEEAIRFAKYWFTGGMQFRPDYSPSPTLLETEVMFEDIAVFIGGDEHEALLKNPVDNIKVTDLRYVECEKCDHSWTFNDDLEDENHFWEYDKHPYLCHKCGYDNDLKKYDMESLKEWQKENGVLENVEQDFEDDLIDLHLNDSKIFEDRVTDQKYKQDLTNLLSKLKPLLNELGLNRLYKKIDIPRDGNANVVFLVEDEVIHKRGNQERRWDIEKNIDRIVKESEGFNGFNILKKNRKKVDGGGIICKLLFKYERIGEVKNKSVLKLGDYAREMGISSFDEFVEYITISTRDLNKTAKNVDKETKELYYRVKDHVIKFLYKFGYIKNIEKHRIENSWFLLVTTSIYLPESYGGYISFHIPPFRYRKFEHIFGYRGIENFPELKDPYERRDTPVVNLEASKKILDIYQILPQSNQLKIFKDYFDEIV